MYLLAICVNQLVKNLFPSGFVILKVGLYRTQTRFAAKVVFRGRVLYERL